MARDALKTLFHPFDTGTIDAPGAEQKVLFLGAEAGFRLPEGFTAEIACVQGFRPVFNRLAASGAAATPSAEGSDYDLALVLCDKFKGGNEARVAEALKRTKPGAMIVLAGAKEDGIEALRKRIAKLGVSVEHMPKYHGQAVWFVRPDNADSLAATLAPEPAMVEDRFRTAPGMFSYAEVDAGSELLAGRLPTDLDGAAADLGAGWGYLSVMLADASPRLKSIDLYEADYAALQMAKGNLAAAHPGLASHANWHDVAGEEIKAKYDFVIMNPPFHEGHAADPALGRAFVKRAADILKIGGSLLMVANRGLPYEDTLATLFKAHGETCRNARYKVLWARK